MSELQPHLSQESVKKPRLAAHEQLGVLSTEIAQSRPKRIDEGMKETLTHLLLSLRIERAHAVVKQLEYHILEGRHDVAADFLNDLIKMRQREFGQELLHTVFPRRLGAGIVLQRDINRLGRLIMNFSPQA